MIRGLLAPSPLPATDVRTHPVYVCPMCVLDDSFFQSLSESDEDRSDLNTTKEERYSWSFGRKKEAADRLVRPQPRTCACR